MRDLRRDDRRGRRMRLGAAAIGAAVAGVAFGTPATAGRPTSVTPGSRVFATPGGPYSYQVPPGVTTVYVHVVGGSGGNGPKPGGRGAVVDGPLPVTPGSTLHVFVGGNGPGPSTDRALAGGFNGGGRANGELAAGGGGASDIRADATDLGSRIVVAAGGGGGGQAAGGDAGHAGSRNRCGSPAAAKPGALSAGGTGGTDPCDGERAVDGTPGTFGAGGTGGHRTDQNNGGGGGGGWYGGGGGGGGWYGGGGGGAYGGGAGGSSLVPAGGTVGLDMTGTPQVRISVPVVTAEFSPPRVRAQTAAYLQLDITRPGAHGALSGVAYRLELPAGLAISGTATSDCGGHLTADSGDSAVQLSGGRLAIGVTSCRVSVPVTSVTAGTYRLRGASLSGVRAVANGLPPSDGPTLTVTRAGQATQPTRPSGDAATRPSGDAATRPSAGVPNRPSGDAATRPSGGAVTRPSDGVPAQSSASPSSDDASSTNQASADVPAAAPAVDIAATTAGTPGVIPAVVPAETPVVTAAEVPTATAAEVPAAAATAPAEIPTVTPAEVPVTTPAVTAAEVPVTTAMAPAVTTAEVPATTPAATTAEIPATSPAVSTAVAPATTPAVTTAEVPVATVPATTPAVTAAEVPVTTAMAPAVIPAVVPAVIPAVAQAAVPAVAPVVIPAAAAGQVITFPRPADVQLSDGARSLSATASSGLPVTFVSLTPAVCTVAGSVVSFHAAGVCGALATQSGDAIWAPAASVAQVFAVNSGSTNFLSGQSTDMSLLGDEPLNLAPTLCGLTGSVLGLLGVKTCVPASVTAKE
ncbi:glycine rich domain-containing protein [Paractinoplanes toevensis]|nr:glycine-rich protein [Actinoplanes toevensis]